MSSYCCPCELLCNPSPPELPLFMLVFHTFIEKADLILKHNSADSLSSKNFTVLQVVIHIKHDRHGYRNLTWLLTWEFCVTILF